jgi:hypothetical protein
LREDHDTSDPEVQKAVAVLSFAYFSEGKTPLIN